MSYTNDCIERAERSELVINPWYQSARTGHLKPPCYFDSESRGKLITLLISLYQNSAQNMSGIKSNPAFRLFGTPAPLLRTL